MNNIIDIPCIILYIEGKVVQNIGLSALAEAQCLHDGESVSSTK